MHQQDGALHRSAGAGEVSLAAVSDIHQRRCDTPHRGRGRPRHRDDAHGELYRSRQQHLRVLLLPGYRQRVRFRVDLDAGRAKRRGRPLDRPRHGRRPRDASAGLIGEASQILGERGGCQRLTENRGDRAGFGWRRLEQGAAQCQSARRTPKQCPTSGAPDIK